VINEYWLLLNVCTSSSYLRRPHFDSRSLAAAVVRGTLVIPSEHCRPRDTLAYGSHSVLSDILFIDMY